MMGGYGWYGSILEYAIANGITLKQAEETNAYEFLYFCEYTKMEGLARKQINEKK